MSEPSGIHRRHRSLRRTFVALLGTLGLAAAAATVAVPSANASAPTPPSGWTQVFLDDFNGAAGTGVNTSNWQYATGKGYPGGPANWGTGEVETMTNSTSNVALDGSGNLRITPLRDSAGNWTSGRIETNRTDFQPPAGGKLRIESPHPDAERHRHRRRGLLAGVLDAGRALPRQLLELAQRRRARHHGERPGPEPGLGHDALRHQPRWPVQRDQRHRRLHGLSGHDVPVGLPHLHDGVGPLGEPRDDPLLRRRHPASTRSTRARWTRRPGPTPPTTASSSS